VLADGDHTLERCGKVTEEVLRTVFKQLYTERVMLEGMILQPNMVLPGLTCPPQQEVKEVAAGEQQYQVRLIDGPRARCNRAARRGKYELERLHNC
jgi:fructose-bisphosphate aldolase, class I